MDVAIEAMRRATVELEHRFAGTDGAHRIARAPERVRDVNRVPNPGVVVARVRIAPTVGHRPDQTVRWNVQLESLPRAQEILDLAYLRARVLLA